VPQWVFNTSQHFSVCFYILLTEIKICALRDLFLEASNLIACGQLFSLQEDVETFATAVSPLGWLFHMRFPLPVLQYSLLE
jgi:hypothetical protein